MDKKDVRLAKKKIIKCLTEDFPYGKTKSGKPRKRPFQNQAIFDKKSGAAMYHGIDLDLLLDKIMLGLYFAMADSNSAPDETKGEIGND